MTNSLILKTGDKVARGVQRSVYLHPHDPTKLVKVLNRPQDMARRHNFNGWIDHLFPSTRVRQIRKEYKEYLRVALNNQHSGFSAPISHMYGFAFTNLGLGCITERVANADGSLGKTLGSKVRDADLHDADIALLNDCIAKIYAHDIRASDMNPENFVFGRRSNGDTAGPRECVLVDGFGDTHAIPVRSMARWSNRMGLNDSCARLARNTRLHWHPQRKTFSR
jgi:hypothetical protein